MQPLRVKKDKVVDAKGKPVQLKGFGIGGWMNTENFINGYPGCEQTLRETCAEILGDDKAEFLFDSMLDHFLDEKDLAFIKKLGANVVRLPLNYRHFERDSKPFKYVEKGFERLDRAIDRCAKLGLYVILDMHAVQGWQDPDWHSDNPYRGTLIWRHPHFQDRFVALWQEFARRYRGNVAIAGYNIMNEPVTGATYGSYGFKYKSDWKVLNDLNRRAVKAIRKIDAEHIIFLEGDDFSSRFVGMDAPFDDDLVYSSHNYIRSGFVTGPYPGDIAGERWDHRKLNGMFLSHEGPRFAKKYGVPLWVGEFGSLLNGKGNDIASRLRSDDDQMRAFEESGAHWTIWTYKDVGYMGAVMLDPDSPYMRLMRPMFKAKEAIATDSWIGNAPPSKIRLQATKLGEMLVDELDGVDIDKPQCIRFLGQATLAVYAGFVLQPMWANAFKGMSEKEIDRVMRSFAFENCKPHDGLVRVLSKHFKG